MCEWGTNVSVRVKVAADLSHTGSECWREFGIDACIAPIVKALQEGGIDMRASCCGHGKAPGRIDLADGRVLTIGSDRRSALDDAADYVAGLTESSRDFGRMIVEGVMERLPPRLFGCPVCGGEIAYQFPVDFPQGIPTTDRTHRFLSCSCGWYGPTESVAWSASIPSPDHPTR